MYSRSNSARSLFSFFTGDDGVFPYVAPSTPPPAEKKGNLIKPDEIKYNKTDRLVLPFSVKSPDFTSRKNSEIFAGWALHQFQESTIWLTGPLQQPTILFESIFKRILSEFLETKEKSSFEKKEESHFTPREAEIKNAADKADKLETAAANILFSYFDKQHKKDPHIKVFRDTYTSNKTPIFPHKSKNIKSSSKSKPPHLYEEKETTLGEGYKTPPFSDDETDSSIQVRARQRIQKIPPAYLSGTKYEQTKEVFKTHKKLFQINSCRSLTDCPFYEQAKLKLDELMKDKILKAEFDILVNDISNIRLRNEFEKLSDEIIAKVFNKYRLINKNISQLDISKNKEQILDYLIQYDYLNLKGLARHYTERFFLAEFPLFIVEAEKAQSYFQATGGRTYFGYPITRSLTKKLFSFTAKMLRASKVACCESFGWIDTSSLLPEKIIGKSTLEKGRP